MKRVVIVGLLTSSCVHAEGLQFKQLQKIREASLEDVPSLISVHKQEQETYKVFYSAFLEELSMLSASRRKRQLQRVANWAKNALRDKNYAYYQELEKQGQFDLALQKASTRAFLTRYAVYQKMCSAQEQHSVFKEAVVDYSKKVADSLVQATRSIKEWLLS